MHHQGKLSPTVWDHEQSARDCRQMVSAVCVAASCNHCRRWRLAPAAVEAELDAQEWNMQEIERIQEEQASLIRLRFASCGRSAVVLVWT